MRTFPQLYVENFASWSRKNFNEDKELLRMKGAKVEKTPRMV